MADVRVRFAPSPTGYLHIGGLRTALFNWLWARKHGGTFTLRIEDTDQKRFVQGATENIIEALKWYGLTIDKGPLYQSEKFDTYKQYAKQLIESGYAYYCFCSPERLAELRKLQSINKQAPAYDGHCRSLTRDEIQQHLSKGTPHVVRLQVPVSGITQFDDVVHGVVKVQNNTIDDQVLLKSDGYPTYHLANVIDDHELGITHVIRAEEWLPSTPKHTIIYQAFGWTPPVFAHLPMVLGPDRAKLSKRHGAMPALDYRDQGYLPEAVLNFIAFLGWNPKTEQEMFALDELIQEFDLAKVNKASAIFNLEKLDWLNAKYIRNMADADYITVSKQYLSEHKDHSLVSKAVLLVKDRIRKLTELPEQIDFIFEKTLTYEPDMLIPKKSNHKTTKTVLQQTAEYVSRLSEDQFQVDELKERMMSFINEHNLTNRDVLWPLRIAVTGQKASPGVFEVMAVLGKEETISRIKHAVTTLQ